MVQNRRAWYDVTTRTASSVGPRRSRHPGSAHLVLISPSAAILLLLPLPHSNRLRRRVGNVVIVVALHAGAVPKVRRVEHVALLLAELGPGSDILGPGAH